MTTTTFNNRDGGAAVQPEAITPAQSAAVSYLARYTGHTHHLYAGALRRWFGWCETNRLDPLTGIHARIWSSRSGHLHESGLRDPSVNTMMHGVRGSFRFAHIDGLIHRRPRRSRPTPRGPRRRETRTRGWTGSS